MGKSTFPMAASFLLATAAAFSLAITGCNEERVTRSQQDESWSVAPRVHASDDLTVNEMALATWVRVEASRDGRVVAFVDSPFSARSAVLRIPDPGAVVVAVSGYEDKERTTMLWTGSSTVETGTANPTVPLARGPGLTPLPKPRFSADSGTFRNTIKLGIAADSAGHEIHYTTDGGDPTTNSPRYTDSLAVDRSMIVSAVAFKKGRALSEVARAILKVKRDTVSAPRVSEGAGEYARILQVALSCDTADVVIRYTTDGSEPDDSSTAYTAPIEVAKSMRIKAFASKEGLTSSGVRTFEYTINLPVLAKPAFSPAGNRFDSAQDVVLTAESGATIHYTTVQGMVPTEKDSIFRGPIRVATTTTISAIAVKSGKTTSPVSSETYSIVPPGTAATPWFEPVGGIYKSAQTVRIKADTGAVVHCTQNGAEPDETSPVCAGSIAVEAMATIKAIAVVAGKKPSSVFTAIYDIRPDTVPAPRMSPVGGDIYDAGQNVTIASDSSSASIHYTLDGGEPTTQSTRYTGPIVLDSTTTIRAIATLAGMANSAIVQATYIVRREGALPEPVIEPAGGIFQDSQLVTIRCDSADAVIHYTTDGSEPTASSATYQGGIMVTSTRQIRAIATREGSPNSMTATAWITIQVAGQAESPRITPNGGTFTGSQNVWIYTVSDTTLKIYYTTNDSTPTTASTLYDGMPVEVSKSMVVKAIATKDGLVNSPVTTARFTIEEKVLDTATAPVVFPDGGTYTDKVLVGLSSSTPGAVIHYTLDGNEPTEGSQVYSDSIPVETSSTLKAIACATGMICSRMDSAVFSVSTRPRVSTPRLDPTSGTFNGSQDIRVDCPTDSVDLRYTLDGSDPDSSSPVANSPVRIDSSVKMKVIAYRSGWLPSVIATEVYEIIQKAATPEFSVDPKDTIRTSTKLELGTSTTGATVFFTLDGSDPDDKSELYKDPIEISSALTVKAVAYASGMAPSDIARADYQYAELGTVTAPSIGPSTTLFVDTVEVAISAPTGADIFYTTDGTDPRTSTSRKQYSERFTISATTTVKAYATMSGLNPSAVRSVTYTLTSRVATPVITPATGSYSGIQYATIGCATPGATIYYTTDGTTPNSSSRIYTETQSVQVSSTTTIKAIALLSGWVPSELASEKITILPQAVGPTFSLVPGTYTSIQSLVLKSDQTGAEIFFTIDGSIPTTSSPKYGTAIVLDRTLTINAIAVVPGYANSVVKTATYTISLPRIDTLTFSMTPGFYTGTQTLSITAPVASATIYYTTDGSEPTTSSSAYPTRGITVSRNTTVKAFAVKTGYSPSAVTTKTYNIRCLPPTLTPDSTDVSTGNKSITMKSNDASCPDIHYTINGLIPTTSAPPYKGPVTVSYDQTLKAVASGTGMSNSTVNSQAYDYKQPKVLDVNMPGLVTFSTSGSVLTTLTVSLASSNSTAIYYTTDWTEPTTASTRYTGPITVKGNLTIKARAYNLTSAGFVSGINFTTGK